MNHPPLGTGWLVSWIIGAAVVLPVLFATIGFLTENGWWLVACVPFVIFFAAGI